MKLLTKTTLAYLGVMLIIFGIGGVVAYRQAKQIVQDETEWALRQDLRIIIGSIRDGVPVSILENQKVNITKLEGTNLAATDPIFSDTLVYTQYTGQNEAHRMVDVIREVDGQFYKFKMFDLFIELDDITDGIRRLMTQLFLSLAVGLVLFTILFSRYLFAPFKKTLDKINTFKIDQQEKLKIDNTTTKEFNQLNMFLSTMTDKAISDYRALKEFTENASHEMQTPLAVASGKLELLIESENLTSEQAKFVESALQSLNKLSRMGKALSLLTKIENKEFSDTEEVDFSQIVEEAVSQFKELGEMQGIEVRLVKNGKSMLQMNKALSEILINNLLKNAIQHNVKNGWVEVTSEKNNLMVRNSGEKPTVPVEHLIARFKKSAQTSGSSGLGLSIVKNICDVNDFGLEYTFQDNIHQVMVRFSKN